MDLYQSRDESQCVFEDLMIPSAVTDVDSESGVMLKINDKTSQIARTKGFCLGSEIFFLRKFAPLINPKTQDYIMMLSYTCMLQVRLLLAYQLPAAPGIPQLNTSRTLRNALFRKFVHRNTTYKAIWIEASHTT